NDCFGGRLRTPESLRSRSDCRCASYVEHETVRSEWGGSNLAGRILDKLAGVPNGTHRVTIPDVGTRISVTADPDSPVDPKRIRQNLRLIYVCGSATTDDVI